MKGNIYKTIRITIILFLTFLKANAQTNDSSKEIKISEAFHKYYKELHCVSLQADSLIVVNMTIDSLGNFILVNIDGTTSTELTNCVEQVLKNMGRGEPYISIGKFEKVLLKQKIRKK